MELGLLYAGAGRWATPEGAVELATTAERMGIDALWTSEHVVVPAADLAARYRAAGGAWDLSEEYSILDPLVWLSYVAATTTTISLATGVIVLPLRRPAVLAKQVASLHILSRGRLILGLGIGWVEEELAACGVRHEDRVAMLEEGLEVMEALWTTDDVSFEGAFTRLAHVTMVPRPTGKVPIVLGGRALAAARRAGRLADGYYPHERDVARLSTLFSAARASADAAGRDPGSVRLIAGGARTPQQLESLLELGVGHVVFPPRCREGEGPEDAIARYLQEVVEPVLGPRPTCRPADTPSTRD